MVECVSTAYTLAWHPIQHLLNQICCILDILLLVILIRNELSEISSGNVVYFVNQLNFGVVYLFAHRKHLFSRWQTQDRDLFYELGPFAFSREKWSLVQELSENASDC